MHDHSVNYHANILTLSAGGRLVWTPSAMQTLHDNTAFPFDIDRNLLRS